MPLRDALLALLCALLWGFNFVVMKVGVAELPPLLLAGLRFALAAVPMIFFLPRPAIPWRWLSGFALAFGVIKFTLLFLGLKLGMPAGLSSVVLQLQAGFTVVLAMLLLGERLGRAQAAGLALAIAGLAVLGAEWIARAPLMPFALVVAAAFAWATANIVTKRAGAVEPLAFAVWTSLIAAGPLLILSVLVEGPETIGAAIAGVTWRGIGAVVYLAYPVNLLGLAIWTALLRRHPAATVAPFSLLVPVFGLTSGCLLLGEAITPWLVAGCGLVIAGLLVNSLGARAVRMTGAVSRPPELRGKGVG